MEKVREIPLSEVGLETCEAAAGRRKCDPATVRRWVNMGWVPAVVVGSGRSRVYLVRSADVDAFTPPKRGRQPAAKKPAEKRRAKK